MFVLVVVFSAYSPFLGGDFASDAAAGGLVFVFLVPRRLEPGHVIKLDNGLPWNINISFLGVSARTLVQIGLIAYVASLVLPNPLSFLVLARLLLVPGDGGV